MPIDEDTGVVSVTNVVVSLDSVGSFPVTGVSRLGFSVPVSAGGIGEHRFPELEVGRPQYAPFKMLLGHGAPLDQLRELWRKMRDGEPTQELDLEVHLTIRNEEGNNVNAVHFTLEDIIVLGFTEGLIGPASLTVMPTHISIVNDALTDANYPQLALPVQEGFTFHTLGNSEALGVYRISGGEESVLLDVTGSGPIGFTLSDLVVTAVGRTPTSKSSNVNALTQLSDWVEDLQNFGNADPTRNVVVNTVAFNGTVQDTVQFMECVPTKVTLINPALVDATKGQRVPYVYDFVLKPTSIQQ